MAFSQPLKGRVRLDTRTDLREYDARLRFVLVLFSIPIAVLFLRLGYLQVIQGADYQTEAESNAIDEMPLPAYRGTVHDREGRVLAENRPSYDVYIAPEPYRQNPDALERLRGHLALSDGEVERILGADERIRIRRDASWEQVAAIETDHLALPGSYVQPVPHRHYPNDDLAVHLLGYMGEVEAGQLDQLAVLGYGEGDYIGQVGLENALEPVLRGHDGLERYVRNVQGDRLDSTVTEALLGDYARIDPVSGRDVFLTIDVELQAIARDAMRDYPTGAVVAIDPRDGSILALVSKPGYNPNAWTGRLSTEELVDALNDENTPLFDRSIHAYFPGSTFKIVTAAAALEEGLVGPEDTLHCDGQYTYGNRVFHCNRRHGHGDITLAEALQQSCNVFFYKLGERLGIERLHEYSELFGFSEAPGSGLPSESSGIVPTRSWLEEHSPEGFQYGQVLNVSVGQGDTRTSPLQMAMAYAGIANGGTLFYPRLIDRIQASSGDVLFEYPSRVRRTLPFRESYLGEIMLGLTMAVNAPGGTAYDARLDYLVVAGKTGTAEGTQVDAPQDAEGMPVEERTSAWFASFAPVEDPQIVVVVLLEHGGSGGRNAAPVGMEVIDRYFREIRDYDVEIQAAIASGDTAELDGLMRLDRPGHESAGMRPAHWAEPYLFGHLQDRPSRELIRQWRER